MDSSLSPITLERLARIQANPESFTPNDFVLSEIGRKSLTMVIGPSGIGKGYLIDAVVSTGSEFAQSRSLTSRQWRSDDTPETIRYLAKTDHDIAAFCDSIESGNYVNYIFHPETNEIYATDLSDHPGNHNLMPTITKSVQQLQALPFGKANAIGLAAEPSQWRQWFDTREFRDNDDRLARIGEGINCVYWLLAHPEVSIVTNASGLDAVGDIQYIIKTGSVQRDEATARAQLRYMQSLT